MEEFRTLVLYRSQHGSTKKYAEWIGDALNADVMEASKRDIHNWSYLMTRYDMVIYGGNLNERGINGLKEFKGSLVKNPVERVAYFCVGSFPDSEETRNEHLVSNFTQDEIDRGVELFYCRGRLDFIGLKFLEKRMMAGLMKAIEKKYPEDRSPGEAEILEAYYDDVDWSGRYYIQPLVEYVKSFMTEEQISEMEPIASERIKARMEKEAEEEEAWNAEMKRREELHFKMKEKEEQDKIKRMSKKQREKYLAAKAAKAAEEEMDQEDEMLSGVEGSVDDYSEFNDDEEKNDEE